MLRKRDVNIQLPEVNNDFLPQIVGNRAFVINVGRKTVELKIKAVVRQIRKSDRWCRIRQNLGIALRYFQKGFFDQFDIAVIIHAHFDFDSPQPVGVGHVDNAF